jgi:hypothetical protein
MLQDLQHNQRVCGAVVLDHIDICVQTKHLLETSSKALLVQPVSLLANGVDKSAVHICRKGGQSRNQKGGKHQVRVSQPTADCRGGMAQLLPQYHPLLGYLALCRTVD